MALCVRYDQGTPAQRRYSTPAPDTAVTEEYVLVNATDAVPCLVVSVLAFAIIGRGRGELI